MKLITESQLKQLSEQSDLEQAVVNDLLGFTKVFRLLKSVNKPIVGHNLLMDLMIMANCFEAPLPKNYLHFKQSINSIFPTVFDTKTISFGLRQSIPETKRWSKNYLESLYNYFRDGNGRHLVLNSPYVEIQGLDKSNVGKFHNAGWDSYCTGYIFIRMAHIHACGQYGAAKNQAYMSSQLLHAVSKYKNCLNLIRGSLAYIVSCLFCKSCVV